MLARTNEDLKINSLAALPMEDVFRLHGHLRTFKRQSLVYSSGDQSSRVYFICSGEVKISRYTPDGRELPLDHIGAGMVFGEMEILLEKSRESQAVARSDLIVYALDEETLLELMATNPDFGLWLNRQMGARQARLETRLESLLFKSANGKVAQVLLNLALDYGQTTPEGTFIEYPITHQEIGNLIATTRETVSYAFMDFRQLGLISTRQRRTIVHDLERLSELAST